MTTTARPRPGLVLCAILLTLLILPTSVTGSGVALPHIAADTDATLGALQWVVHAYNLTFASFMLACGSLADRLGRRRVFVIGATVFILSSLVSAVAGNVYLLDASRAAAGIGAAALLTSSSSLLSVTFSGAARARAFAGVGITTGAGLALGAMAAGVLADTLGWRAFFAAHALLMLLALAAVPYMDASRAAVRASVDWPGTATLVGSLFALMFGVVEGPQQDWDSPTVLGSLSAAVLLLAAFVAVERRHPHPMFDLRLLRHRRFMALCLIPVVVSFAFVLLLPLLPNFFVVANGWSSQRAGTAMLLMTAPILLTPVLASGMVRRGLSSRTVFAISLLAMTAGTAWLAVVLRPGIDVATLAGPLLLLGAGMGLNFGMVDGAALTEVPAASTGTAAGFLNTLRLGSEAVVIAAAASALVDVLRARFATGLQAFPGYPGQASQLANDVNSGDITGPLSTVPDSVRDGFAGFLAHGYTHAWQVVLFVSAAICAALSVTIYLMLAPATTGKAAIHSRLALAETRRQHMLDNISS